MVVRNEKRFTYFIKRTIDSLNASGQTLIHVALHRCSQILFTMVELLQV
jgi:hypothetical protein